MKTKAIKQAAIQKRKLALVVKSNVNAGPTIRIERL